MRDWIMEDRGEGMRVKISEEMMGGGGGDEV